MSERVQEMRECLISIYNAIDMIPRDKIVDLRGVTFLLKPEEDRRARSFFNIEVSVNNGKGYIENSKINNLFACFDNDIVNLKSVATIFKESINAYLLYREDSHYSRHVPFNIAKVELNLDNIQFCSVCGKTMWISSDKCSLMQSFKRRSELMFSGDPEVEYQAIIMHSCCQTCKKLISSRIDKITQRFTNLDILAGRVSQNVALKVLKNSVTDRTAPQQIRDIRGLRRLTSINVGFIYFLINGKNLVYIGKTNSLGSRIKTHIREKGGCFDSVYYVQTDKSVMSEVESYFINLFKPKLNKVIPTDVEDIKKSVVCC